MGAALTIQDFDDRAYDPFTSDEVMFGDIADPYAVISEWRTRGPVFRGSFRQLLGVGALEMDAPETFVVVGSDEINEVLTDTRRFNNGCFMATMGITFGAKSLSVLDGPEHARYRLILQKALSPRQVQAWGESVVDPVVRELMQPFVGRGRAELIAEFTLRYPFEIIYRQLALPASDVRTFHRLAFAQTDYMHPDKAVEASAKLGDYFRGLVAERRARPGDDLVSLLALTEVDGERLPEEVLVCFLRQLMNAGGDTTYRGTSVLLTALLTHPEQLDAVRADRSLIPEAIEEALRWDGPVAVHKRLAIVDTELAGVPIPAGAELDCMSNGGANRDPAHYPEPHRFDIFRQRKSHISFARGPHICVGQHLARVEMTRALNALLDRLPNLRLDPDYPPPQLHGAMMRVPKALHVRFG